MNKVLLSIPLLGALLTFPTMFGMNNGNPNNPGKPLPSLVTTFLDKQRLINAAAGVAGGTAAIFMGSNPLSLVAAHKCLHGTPKALVLLGGVSLGFLISYIATELTNTGVTYFNDTNPATMKPHVTAPRYVVGGGGAALAATIAIIAAFDGARSGGYLVKSAFLGLKNVLSKAQEQADRLS